MSITLTDSNGCLKTGMRSDILRTSFETKNVLLEKGAIYTGTGSTVSRRTDEDRIDIYKTSYVPRGGNSDTVLTFNSTGVSPLSYQKIGPDTVVKKENYNIKVDEAEETASADYAEVADYVTSASAPTGKSTIAIQRLKDLNTNYIGQGARMNLSYDGKVVGWVQIHTGLRLGNYEEIALHINITNSHLLFPFYKGGGSGIITGSLWAGPGTYNLPESVTGFFPSGMVTGTSFNQSLALKYTILNDGKISITCPHPFPQNINEIEKTDIYIGLNFRMPDVN